MLEQKLHSIPEVEDNNVKPPYSQTHCYVQLIRCKNNFRAFYSKTCPFCGEVGKRPFRYNSKLKVGKSFCCGVSFKDISWLKLILFDRDKYEINMITTSWLLPKEEKAKQEYINKRIEEYYKDKMSIKQSGFEKSDLEDLSLPF